MCRGMHVEWEGPPCMWVRQSGVRGLRAEQALGHNWSGVEPPLSLQPRLPHGLPCASSSQCGLVASGLLHCPKGIGGGGANQSPNQYPGAVNAGPVRGPAAGHTTSARGDVGGASMQSQQYPGSMWGRHQGASASGHTKPWLHPPSDRATLSCLQVFGTAFQVALRVRLG